MAARSPPTTPTVIRSTFSFAGPETSGRLVAICSIKPIRARPAPSRRGRMSAPSSPSIPAANSFTALSSVTLQNLDRQRRQSGQRRSSISAPTASPNSPIPAAPRKSANFSKTALPPANCNRSPSTARTGRRHVFERPDHSAGGDYARDLQRPELLASAQRRRLCGHRRFRAPDLSAHRQHRPAARSRHRTSISPPSSANLIVAQQAYSANAKVMSTADQMIQSLLQVIQ